MMKPRPDHCHSSSSARLRRRKLLALGAGLLSGPVLGKALFRKALASEALNLRPNLPRVICYSFPNGCESNIWNFQDVLAPLAELKSTVHVFRGLRNTVAEGTRGDGHHMGAVCLFTATLPVGDAKSGGPSLDHLAFTIQDSSALRSPLAMGVTNGIAGGSLRSVNWRRRSWNESGESNPFITDPLQAFQLLYGSSLEEAASSLARERQLGAVMQDFRSLLSERAGLSPTTRQQLTRDFEALISLKRQANELSKALAENQCNTADELSTQWQNLSQSDFRVIHENYTAIFEAQQDLLVSAFACDLVRAGNLMFGTAGDDYMHAGYKFGDHYTSHYYSDETYQVYRNYRQLHIRGLRRLIDRLKDQELVDGQTLYDSTIIVAGSEFGDGRSHKLSPQPHLVAGGQSFLAEGKEWDLAGQATPKMLYATIEATLRSAYARPGAGLHFGDSQVDGLKLG